jgi:Cu(I)-responsive transcriptional regulator
MWIGRTAKAAGVNAQTLRYYERRGLIGRARRGRSGYREYSAEAVAIVRFIKRAQELGFALDEIEQLIKLRNVRRADRHRVRALAERKIVEIDRKIAHLRSMREALASLVASCHRGDAADCPIIEALTEPMQEQA